MSVSALSSPLPDEALVFGRALQTILVADDEHLVAKGVCEDLAELGYEVCGPAPNGQVAVELASRDKPDLAILDLRMPEVDGVTAARSIYEGLGIPVVILSAYSDPEFLEQTLDIGVFAYLLKPVSAEALRVTLPVAWRRFLDYEAKAAHAKDLAQQLADRKLIERAKGVLQQRLGITEPEAMKRLQKQARDTRKPMVELAKAVLDAEGLLD